MGVEDLEEKSHLNYFSLSNVCQIILLSPQGARHGSIYLIDTLT